MYMAVLVSGSGTNLQAIIDAIEAGELDGKLAVVITSHESARAVERAHKHGIEALYIDRAKYPRPRDFDQAVVDELTMRGVELIVMAGYMRLLGPTVLEQFPNKVVNIHPSLLPAFAGANGIHDAFAHGVKVTGVTVHFANEVFDEGPIIAQETVRIEDDDTAETLEAKIHEVEHRLYPQVLQWIVQGRVHVHGRRVAVDKD